MVGSNQSYTKAVVCRSLRTYTNKHVLVSPHNVLYIHVHTYNCECRTEIVGISHKFGV